MTDGLKPHPPRFSGRGRHRHRRAGRSCLGDRRRSRRRARRRHGRRAARADAAGWRALPSGPFEITHRSLQSGLRAWVERQANHPLGYVEQLYTFADRDRGLAPDQRVISISYLGLTREQQPSRHWRSDRLAGLVQLSALGGPARWRSADDRHGDPAGLARLRQIRGIGRRAAGSRQPHCASLSARMGGRGTRNSFCSATNCCSRRA